MTKMNKASVMHSVEALLAFSFAAFLVWVFQDPMTELFYSLIKSEKVVSSIEGGTVIILGAVFSGMSKKFRMDPNVPSYPDFVNDGVPKSE